MAARCTIAPMAKMTKLIGTNGAILPRLLVPREVALKWKDDKAWDVARGAARMPFAPKGNPDDQPRYSSFAVKGAPGFAIHYAFGAVGFVASPTGGVFVCWVDSWKKGTGELPSEKLTKLIGSVPAKKWRADSMRVRGIGSHALSYCEWDETALGYSWLDVDLPVGDYELHTIAPHKTPLGTLAYFRLTRVGAQAAAPTVVKTPPAEKKRDRELAKRAKTLKWGETDGGPLICMQDAVAKQWTGGEDDGGDYDRACKPKALCHLLGVGKTKAIVLGYPNDTTWLELGKGRGLLVQALAANSPGQMLELALATADKPGWKKVGTLDVGDGKLRIQDALSPGKAPEHPVARFTLPRGTYLVEQLPRIASSEGAQIVPVRLTKQ